MKKAIVSFSFLLLLAFAGFQTYQNQCYKQQIKEYEEGIENLTEATVNLTQKLSEILLETTEMMVGEGESDFEEYEETCLKNI